MRTGATTVRQDVAIGAAGVFEGVGEDSKATQIEMATRQFPFIVDRLGQLGDGGVVPGEPGGVDGDGAEGVAEDVGLARLPGYGVLPLP